MKTVLLGTALLATWTTVGWAQDDVSPHQATRSPDFGFDYRAFVAEHLQLISEGESEKAIAHLQQRMKTPIANSEDVKKQYAAVYGLCGRYEGHEFIGYRRLASRAYRLYFFVQYEKQIFSFTYLFVHQKSDDAWRCQATSFSGNVETFDEASPFQPLEEEWQTPMPKTRR